MIYSDFIKELRKTISDLVRKSPTNYWDGDASTTLFITKEKPVIDDSYTIKVGGVAKTETTDFTLNKDIGEMIFTSAPAAGTDNVTADYKYAKYRDADYFEMIKNAFGYCQNKLWKETIDTSTFVSVASQYEYSGPEKCLFLVEGHYRQSSSDPWTRIDSYSNLTYLKNSNKIKIDPYFDTAGYYLKFRYGRSLYTDFTVVSGSLNGDHTAAVATITASSTTGFDPLGGIIKIDSEEITYTGTTTTTFTGCTRGANNTTAATHSNGAVIYSVLDIDDAESWLPAIKCFVLAEFYEREAARRAYETAAVVENKTYSTSATLISLAQYNRRLGEQILERIYPRKPAINIPIIIQK